jgi:hypothetical protein
VTEQSLRSLATFPGESKPAISRHLAKDRARSLAQTAGNPSTRRENEADDDHLRQRDGARRHLAAADRRIG